MPRQTYRNCLEAQVPSCFNEGRGRCPAKPGFDGTMYATLIFASMKGGADAPPNLALVDSIHHLTDASMKGGADAPPNMAERRKAIKAWRASMKGGADAPPNVQTPDGQFETVN